MAKEKNDHSSMDLLRQQLTDVFGPFDNFADKVKGKPGHHVYGVINSVPRVSPLPYTSAAVLPSAQLCLQSMQNLVCSPMLSHIPPPKKLRRSPSPDRLPEYCEPSCSSADEDENKRKRKREDGGNLPRKRDEDKSEQRMKDLFGEEEDDESDDSRAKAERGGDADCRDQPGPSIEQPTSIPNSQSILAAFSQLSPLLSPIKISPTEAERLRLEKEKEENERIEKEKEEKIRKEKEKEEEERREKERLKKEKKKEKERRKKEKEELLIKKEEEEKKKKLKEEKKEKRKSDEMKVNGETKETKREKEGAETKRNEDEKKEGETSGKLPLGSLSNEKIQELIAKVAKMKKEGKKELEEKKEKKEEKREKADRDEKQRKEEKEERRREKERIKEKERGKEKEREKEKVKEEEEKADKDCDKIVPFSLVDGMEKCLISSCIPSTIRPPEEPPSDYSGKLCEFYTKRAKEEKYKADKEQDKVLRLLTYLDSVVLFTLSAIADPVENVRFYPVIKDTCNLIHFVTKFYADEKPTATSSPLSQHFASRVLMLGLRIQSIFNYHMYKVRSKRLTSVFQNMEKYESQVEEMRPSSSSTPQQPPPSRHNGALQTPPSPSSSTHSAHNQTAALSVPAPLHQMHKSSSKTLQHIHLCCEFWEESETKSTPADDSFFERIESLVGRLDRHSSLDRLIRFLLVAIEWMRTEYIAERARDATARDTFRDGHRT